jgi:hypothetical protein
MNSLIAFIIFFYKSNSWINFGIPCSYFYLDRENPFVSRENPLLKKNDPEYFAVEFKRQKMKKIILLFGLLMLLNIYSNAQSIGVDSKGKSIFTHYSRADARLEVSTDEPFSLSYIVHPGITSFQKRNLDKGPALSGKAGAAYQTDLKLKKFRGTLIQVSMLNSSDYLALNNLLDIRPGLGLKLGHQVSIGDFDELDNIPRAAAYTGGFNAILNIDNIKLYNTDNNLEEKKLPVTCGAEFNYSLFFKNRKKDRNIRNVFAVNGMLVRTWNDDDLISYQKISDVTILPNVVALKEFEGRYGKLQTDVTKFRLAVSGPMYIGYVNPIPYVVVNLQTKSNPIYYLGVFTNILTKPLSKTHFKIPTSIGLGIDTKLQGGVLSRPNVFIKGSISFGEFK